MEAAGTAVSGFAAGATAGALDLEVAGVMAGRGSDSGVGIHSFMTLGGVGLHPDMATMDIPTTISMRIQTPGDVRRPDDNSSPSTQQYDQDNSDGNINGNWITPNGSSPSSAQNSFEPGRADSYLHEKRRGLFRPRLLDGGRRIELVS